MARERPAWFWAITLIFMMAWVVGGTQAVFFILEGQVILGEIVVILSTVIIVVLYYTIDWLLTRK